MESDLLPVQVQEVGNFGSCLITNPVVGKKSSSDIKSTQLPDDVKSVVT